MKPAEGRQACKNQEPCKPAYGRLLEPRTSYMKHDLFEELDAFDPRWQQHYLTLQLAAAGAGVLGLYYAYLRTPEGILYQVSLGGVPNYRADTGLQAAQELSDQAGGDAYDDSEETTDAEADPITD